MGLFALQTYLAKVRSPTMVALALFSVILLTKSNHASAQYLYFHDASSAHRQLIEDLQGRNPDTSNLGPTAQMWLQSLEAMVERLPSGDMKVCQTLQVQYPNGSEFSFRTIHAPVKVDWVVNVTRSPEVVMAIVAIPVLPQIGNLAPAVLPLYPGAQETLTPPTLLGCPVASTRIASGPERQAACSRWPKMCQKL